MKANCYKCAQELEYLQNTPVGRADSCPKCSSSVRACKNCKFYDVNKHNECSEPQSERVVDKEKSNFCDYFALLFHSKDLSSIQNKEISAKDKILSELDLLFKK